MKNRWFAALLALTLLVNGASVSAFAVEPEPAPGGLDNNMMVDPDTGDNYIPPDSAVLDFGNGQHEIQIAGDKVSVDGLPANVAKDYIIRGTQKDQFFRMQKATVPVTIDTDLTSALPITSTSLIKVTDGKLVDAPSMTYVPTNMSKASTYYPVAIAVPNTIPGEKISVVIDDDPKFTRTVASDGKAHFWLDPANYEITLSTKARTAAYTVTVKIDTKGNIQLSKKVEAPAFSFAGGNGTSATPYLIANETQLQQLQNAILKMNDKFFRLSNDITVYNPSTWAGIPNFTGTFDGNGKTITLDGSLAPLFQTIGTGSTVQNLTIVGSINGSGNLGAVAVINNGTITNVTSKANVTATGNAGGIVAQNTGSISGTTFEAIASADGIAGGIAAINSGTISKSGSTASVRASGGYAGGIAGENTGTITIAYGGSTVSAPNYSAGGIAGLSSGNIDNSYSTGTINGRNTGGIIGEQGGGTLTTSYSTAGITSSNYAGGLVGLQVSGRIENSFALNSTVYGSSGNTGRVVGATLARSVPNSGNSAFFNMSVTAISGDSTATGKNGEAIDYNKIYYKDTFASKGFSYPTWNVRNGMMPVVSSIPNAPREVPTLSYLQVTTPTAPPSNGGGGGGGGNNEPPYSETFWKDITEKIEDADSGDKIKFSSAKLDNMPISILKLLKGKNITLEITHGRDKIRIHGKNMHPIPGNRVFYTFGDLANLYEEQPASSSKPTSSKPASSTPKPVQPVTPAPPATTPTTPPAAPPPAASTSTSSEESSSSEEESSRPPVQAGFEDEDSSSEEAEEVIEPEAPKKPIAPLIIAGIIMVIALIGGGAAFYFGYYRKRGE